jgi:peptide-methionine (S)-S-oxide reductase
MNPRTSEVATLGGGCFWCTEAIFREVKGVTSVVSGYTGGSVPGRPTYREICSGLTGHAEVVQISFNATLISFSEILLIFMTTHDAITLNKQGGDVGTQYRSVIFYHHSEQQRIAETVVKEIGRYFKNKVVTEISPLRIFFNAEDYHQDYYKKNTSQAYCQLVINPKLAKLRKLYRDKLKT